MKAICFSVMLCFSMITGCNTSKPTVVPMLPVSETIIDSCPLPSGYQLSAAVETATATLSYCPEKFDEVFAELLEVSKHSPDPENAKLIQDLLKTLIQQNKISESYSKSLYKQYFSPRFVSIPDIKVYRLSSQTDSIKKDLRHELELKRIGMVECCGDKRSFKLAEVEFNRLLIFIENLLLNEEYLQSAQQ
jgi:hypothetical protein